MQALPSDGAAPALTSGAETPTTRPGPRRIALVGGPNVGKSALFTALTGRYVAISNYPGTTVETSRAIARLAGPRTEVIDTPGLESLRALREEERVTQRLLLNDPPEVVAHVVRAGNLALGLCLTCELLEAGLPTVLVVNMMDELRGAGGRADLEKLGALLGIPVVGTVATSGEGVDRLREILNGPVARSSPPPVEYPEALRRFFEAQAGPLARLGMGARAAGILLLEKDPDLEARAAADPGLLAEAAATRHAIGGGCEAGRDCAGCLFAAGTAGVQASVARRAWCEDVARRITEGAPSAAGPAFPLDAFLLHPVGGFAVLAAVLYALYQVVGVLGAGVLVDAIESTVFEQHLTPWVTRAVEWALPWIAARDLMVGPNGIWTLGITYAVAIIVPIVGLFYLCFGVLEDTGYLPRLGVLAHRFLSRVGLGGQAAIPLILGLGCVSTATLATRALPTRRERLIAVVLLSLAIPCAAQFGVVLAILSVSVWAVAAWLTAVGSAFLLTGALAGRGLAGPSPLLLTELPPLRWPRPGNILRKSAARIRWYFAEILPFFLIASVLLWLLDLAGFMPAVEAGLRPLVRAVGLPDEASRFLLFGFFRRDYGAAGLHDLAQAGALDLRQLVVAAVLLTLFIPCIAQLLILRKEFGARMTAAVVAFVFVAAFAAAAALNLGLVACGL